jgi:alpha-1,2-mannosyltransferase
LESSFKGQLPGYYSENLELPLSTRYIDKLFNDLNKEVPERYIDINSCHFIIDTDSFSDDNSDKKHFFNRLSTIQWRTIVKLPFLETNSNDNYSAWNKILKSFYIPYLSQKHNKITYFKLRVRI